MRPARCVTPTVGKAPDGEAGALSKLEARTARHTFLVRSDARVPRRTKAATEVVDALRRVYLRVGENVNVYARLFGGKARPRSCVYGTSILGCCLTPRAVCSGIAPGPKRPTSRGAGACCNCVVAGAFSKPAGSEEPCLGSPWPPQRVWYLQPLREKSDTHRAGGASSFGKISVVRSCSCPLSGPHRIRLQINPISGVVSRPLPTTDRSLVESNKHRNCQGS